MKVIENITKVVKMVVWIMMGIGCVISILGTIASFKWLKSLPTVPLVPDED